MIENDKSVHLGDGVADKVKENINENISDALTLLSNIVFDYLKGKIKDIPKGIEKLLSSPDAKQEIVTQWSNQLFEKGIIPKGYNGLPDELLIANFHQDGYLDGLYAGYALAMMTLVDNQVEKELILSVRDAIRPNLVGHRYNNRDEFYKRYKGETYSWVETIGKTQEK
ncbi:hypothetical protein [Clostridium botulinum]|uniref:hypothetical protein n=1 Tax=Clostridium botulinum TaxID=1491 RepID=UPI000774089B|nr:hypothetical protein [Clostridium botulinum]NFL36766.1 hypothetical protein [Clostridium botulinum]NFL64554.1 hypothetical protein [Clostridium botulinum]NFN06680.1 hypothetical protein [Clostridium botulinum]NFN23544.1 hypothetical protein [Clostridium botulinum]NFN30170.1 hypothetical protein [Clostridium botulinum]